MLKQKALSSSKFACRDAAFFVLQFHAIRRNMFQSVTPILTVECILCRFQTLLICSLSSIGLARLLSA